MKRERELRSQDAGGEGPARLRQGLEGLCLESVARVEGVHPASIQRWIERAAIRATAADRQ